MTIVSDFRAALRSIKRTPVSSAAVALTLALGIGLNTAIFSVVHAVLLEPLDYDQPDRLVIVQAEHRADDRTNVGISGVDFRSIQRDSRSFESIEAATTIRQNLTGIESAEQIQVGWVSNGFFEVLRTRPFLGRYFAPDEQPGSVVLSFGVWQRAFGGDEAALGQTVRLDAQAYTVIGVLPPSFRLYTSASAMDVDVWKNPDGWWQNGDLWTNQGVDFGAFRLIGRIHDGVTAEQVNTELDNIATALRGEVAAYDAAGYHLSAIPLAERVTSGARSTLLLLLGAVSLVFLIACGNVMNLMLVRAESRRRELATRVALGADGGKVVRLLLTEGTTLALAGGLVGLGIAVIGTKMLALFGPQDVPRLDQVGLNAPVLLFGMGITLLSVIAFGLVPALRASRRDVYADLSVRGAAGRGNRHRLSGGLVIAQLGVSLMLLIGAGLLTRSLTQLNEVDPGFDHENLFTFAVSIPGARYTWPEQTNLFFLELEERVEALPGVVSANVVWPLPMSGATWPGRYEGGSVEEGERAEAGYRLVTPSYFETVGTRLLEGRDFGSGDPKATVIVSENLARHAWPGQSAVGRRIRANPWGGRLVDFEVIGVAEDVLHDLREPARQTIYFDSEGWAWSDWEVNYAVRVTGNPNAVIQPIRAEIAAMDSEIPMAMAQTMDEYIDERLAAHRFALLLIGTFAAVAAALAAIGLYGVISHAVSLRGREIGIRIALGSNSGGVIRLVLAQGLRVAVLGIAVGAVGAALLTRVLGSYLFGVTATDPTTFVLLSAGLAAVAIAASLIPALRAATLDPMVVLRNE